MATEEILKDYTDNIFKGQYLIDNPKDILTVSPNLDIGLGGGIPDGSVMIISGKMKTGKTSLCLHICKNAQKKGKQIHYNDIECRLKKRDIEGISGLDPAGINIIRSSPGNIMSAEKHLDAVDKLCRNHTNIVVVMDSVSQLYSEKQMLGDIGDVGRDPTKLMLSEFCKRLQTTVPINNNIVIMIVHLIANTSGYGASYVESGGSKVGYACDIKMQCKSIEPWKVGSGEKQSQVGQIVHWRIDTTALNAPPGRVFKSYLKYGHGIDEAAEIIDTGLELGIISKKGSWYKCDLISDQQFQGQEKLMDALREDKAKFNKIFDNIQAMIA